MENLNRSIASNWYRWGRDYSEWGTKLPHQSTTKRLVCSRFPKVHQNIKIRTDGLVYNSETHELFRADHSTLKLLRLCDGNHSIELLRKRFGTKVGQVADAQLIS